MKNNLRRLNWIVKLFGVENIYRAECDKDKVTIFSHESSATEIWLFYHGFTKAELDEFQLIKWVRGNYQVILH